MIKKSKVDDTIARDLLNRLQKSRITLGILRKTGIGRTVNSLRRLIANEDLSTLAKSLLRKWKKLILESSSVSTNSNYNRQQSQETNTNTSKTVEHQSSQTTSDGDKASHIYDKIQLKSRELITADPMEFAARVEDVIFKELKDIGVKYENRVRRRISNLKDLKNLNLRTNVLLRIITLELLAVLTAQEMASDTLEEEEESALNEDIDTDLIQCERNKQNICGYTKPQTHSANEPMSSFVFCKNCGHRCETISIITILNLLNGRIKKLNLENDGSTRSCEWPDDQMTYDEVHNQHLTVYSFTDKKHQTSLYDFEHQPLDVKQFETFADYISKYGLNRNSTVVYLYTSEVMKLTNN
ncbi:unnamed protein product [Adineta steineri]|uniref:Uncharacterized protein n=1 Tax=Adineta steineri TaxID=433720 RepID=A0A814GIG7_9BILA|nr:unnamed protein product [Adineta steineri]CAF1221265.1 unnamed protein product [Adineta steineri]